MPTAARGRLQAERRCRVRMLRDKLMHTLLETHSENATAKCRGCQGVNISTNPVRRGKRILHGVAICTARPACTTHTHTQYNPLAPFCQKHVADWVGQP